MTSSRRWRWLVSRRKPLRRLLWALFLLCGGAAIKVLLGIDGRKELESRRRTGGKAAMAPKPKPAVAGAPKSATVEGGKAVSAAQPGPARAAAAPPRNPPRRRRRTSPPFPGRRIVAAALILLIAGATTFALFTKTSANSGNTYASAADFRAPTVDRAVIQPNGGNNASAGFVKQGQSYFVYANVTDTGSPAS